jgi:RNA polymerase sigma-70 factor (ECF subfamily)
MNSEFDRIFDLYNKDIFRLIFSYTLNYDDSKDILQDVFLKYYKKMAHISCDDIEIKKWLIKVAINSVNDYYRSFWHKKTIKVEETTFDNKKMVSNNNINLLEELNKLDKKYRIPIYLYYYQGYDIKEISDILKISVSAVKMRLLRAKKILKIEMENNNERFQAKI